MSYLIRRLQEQRANAWEQAKNLLDAAEAEKRDLSAEEDAQYTKINAEIDALDARARELADAEESRKNGAKAIEDLLKEAPEVRANVDKDENEILRSFLLGETGQRSMELRDLSKGTATAGGNTVPTSFYSRLVEYMIETSGVLQAGPTVLNTDGGETLEIPKVTANGAKASIVAEAGTLAEGDPTFGKVTLGAYKYGKLLDVSSELVQDTGVNLLDFLARDMGRAIGLGTGEHFLTGTGSGQPQGVLTASTAGKTGASAGVFTPTGDDLIDLFYSVISPYRSGAVWLVNDATMGSIRKLKDSNGQYLFQPSLTLGTPDTILGKAVYSDVNMPTAAASAKSVLFGDFSTYWVRRVTALRLERSTDFRFDTDQITYRVLIRTDAKQIDTSGAVKHWAAPAA